MCLHIGRYTTINLWWKRIFSNFITLVSNFYLYLEQNSQIHKVHYSFYLTFNVIHFIACVNTYFQNEKLTSEKQHMYIQENLAKASCVGTPMCTYIRGINSGLRGKNQFNSVPEKCHLSKNESTHEKYCKAKNLKRFKFSPFSKSPYSLLSIKHSCQIFLLGPIQKSESFLFVYICLQNKPWYSLYNKTNGENYTKISTKY